jgi:hypothetical protein
VALPDNARKIVAKLRSLSERVARGPDRDRDRKTLADTVIEAEEVLRRLDRESDHGSTASLQLLQELTAALAEARSRVVPPKP